jgi:hypothetical protein
MEEFRDIKDFENYQVSNLGRIYSKNKRACIKVKRLAGRGYYQIRLYKDGKYFYKNLHRIIAETFIPNPNNYRTVNHINGNKLDNRVSNLEWADDCRQQHHACLLGLKPTTKYILTEKDIIDVYEMYSKGTSVKEIAELYDTRSHQIYKLVKGQRHQRLFRQYRDKFNL